MDREILITDLICLGSVFVFMCGYWMRGKVDEIRAINRTLAFDKKVKWGLEHPCELVPTPKVKLVSRMLKRKVALMKIDKSDEYGGET